MRSRAHIVTSFATYLHNTRWQLRDIRLLLAIALPRLQISLLAFLLGLRDRYGRRRRGARLAKWDGVAHDIDLDSVARHSSLAIDTTCRGKRAMTLKHILDACSRLQGVDVLRIVLPDVNVDTVTA